MAEDHHPAVASFVEEARELLEALEGQLLDLEANATPDRLDGVFRTLHTVKGSGAMFGFTVLAGFTHHFEEAFDHLRKGRLAVDLGLVNLCLRARDHMIALLDLGGDGPEAEALARAPEAKSLLAALSRLTDGSVGNGSAGRAQADSEPATRHPADDGGCLPQRWEIRFRPDRDALRRGMRPDLLIEELAALGEAQVALDAAALPTLEALDPQDCHLAWHVLLTVVRPTPEIARAEIEAVFIFAEDATVDITRLTAPAGQETAVNHAGQSDLSAPEPAGGQASHAPAAGHAGADRGATGSGGLTASAVRTATSGRPAESIRVPSAKLDRIMDQLGELVIAQARLHKLAADVGHPELESVVETVERLITGLREETLSVRMLPIEGVFGKFRRVVRDLAGELEKEVELWTAGGDTELDKTVLDQLTEPLVHMIRNAVDHGIEPATTRAANGKPVRGRLCLEARQEGGEVLITLEDDGAGLDTEAIRARAVDRGLIGPDATPSEAELQQLVFAPGFSTARTLSSVSGRGVGMDAVLSTIEALRGTVEIASHSGRGTRVTLRLPMTMAIMDGLLVRLGQTVLVIPLAAIEECVEMDASQAERMSGRRTLEIRNALVPFVALEKVLGLAADPGARRRVVVVRAEAGRMGLMVDDILGQNQTVIKPLSPYHRDIPGLAGATILGDGSIALIIDVATLCRGMQRSGGRTRRPAA